MPPTVLVFRDQHKQEIRNYAIVGQTLWSFGSPRTEKIPLTDLDLAATTKANDDRGLTFRLPAARRSTIVTSIHRSFSPFTASNHTFGPGAFLFRQQS